MRRKFEIDNRTHWQTRHLRAFLVRAANAVLRDGQKPMLHVRIIYTRPGRNCTGYSSGHASLGGAWSTLRIAKDDPDKVDFAFVAAHEFAHNAGLRHAEMEGSPRFCRTESYREWYEWAETLPLEMKPQKPRPGKLAGKPLARADRPGEMRG